MNYAGLALGVNTADENKIEDVITVMNTNVIGCIAFCTAFLPGMRKRQEGHIFNMGSVAGHYSYTTGSGS